jgi:hypothetical protein
MGVALAAVAAVILVAAVGLPRIPWVIRDLLSAIVTGDPVNGGIKHRDKLLRDHPFPPALAPTGYRIKSIEAMSDGEETLGWAVYFAGPDDEDSISYYPHAMGAGGVYDYWKRGSDSFGTEPLLAENLGSRSFCEEDEALYQGHRVSCIAAFDGMAIIAESVNGKPERGSLEHAVTLLRAGVAYWESIRE